MRMLRGGIAAGILLTLSSCITLPHKATPGWLCTARAPGTAQASADLAEDGSLLLALWSWSWRADGDAYGIAAFAHDGNAHSYDAPTTGAVDFPAMSSVAEVVLSHKPGEAGWADPVATRGPFARTNGITIEWDRLVMLAGKAEPLYVLRRLGDGPVMTIRLPKETILDGARQLSEARSLLSTMVGDRARHCQHVDDLYPAIVLT